MNKHQIEMNIRRIEHYGKKMDAFVQLTALAVVLHSHEHGEISLVNKLVMSMAGWKGARHKAMNSWLLAYAPVTINADADAAKAGTPFVLDKERIAATVEERNEIALANGKEANHWYNHSPEPALPEFIDVEAMLKAVMKKVTKLEKDGVPMKDPTMLAKLTTILG